MRSLLYAIVGWFEARLNLGKTLKPIMDHPIPRAIEGPQGWWYVFGSAALSLFLVQIITGIGLALVYVPSAESAYDSLIYLNYEQPFGWFLRALHFYAGSAMLVLVIVHMTQVFLHGAYKYPRELTWVIGVFLFFMTAGMMFTGQVMRWDTDAYWGVGVGAAMMGRIPWIGPAVVHVLLGGPNIGGETLTRFFSLHVFIIPGLLILFLVVHLYLVIRRGVSEPPDPNDPVDPKTYDEKYEKVLKDGVPFAGEAIIKDILFSSLVLIIVVGLAVFLGPKGPSDPPDPTIEGASPRPDWPFMWLFALLALSPPKAETAIILILPVIMVVGLIIVPFVSNRGHRAPSRRPMAVIGVVLVFAALTVLTVLGFQAPWSPAMDAWSGDPVPKEIVKTRTPLELQGAIVFQNKNCRNCHALDGVGGHKGPDLTYVGTRLTKGKLIDQISNGTPGGGNMPAYGKQMGPEEMSALVEFLVSLRPEGVPAVKPRDLAVAKPES